MRLLAAGTVLVSSIAWLPSTSLASVERNGPAVSNSVVKSTAATSVKRKPAARAATKPSRRAAVAAAPLRPSVGQQAGLHDTDDLLGLKSSVALVIDRQTDQVVFSKNATAVQPIASITKLMTALVVADAGLPLDEVVSVTQEDVQATSVANSRSRLVLGTRLTRGEMLHLALMSSDNRAAHVLGRSYPGGLDQFVSAMNAKALELGMADTRYVEPTGLSSDNRSSAQDLSRLVRAAAEHSVIREYSTTPEAVVPVGRRQVQFRNSNGLVHNPEWDILIQKTGYIAAAGRCVVMQAQLAGRQFIMVLLDSAGKYSRIADAERLRKWLVQTHALQANTGSLSLAPVAAEIQPR